MSLEERSEFSVDLSQEYLESFISLDATGTVELSLSTDIDKITITLSLADWLELIDKFNEEIA